MRDNGQISKLAAVALNKAGTFRKTVADEQTQTPEADSAAKRRTDFRKYMVPGMGITGGVLGAGLGGAASALLALALNSDHPWAVTGLGAGIGGTMGGLYGLGVGAASKARLDVIDRMNTQHYSFNVPQPRTGDRPSGRGRRGYLK